MKKLVFIGLTIVLLIHTTSCIEIDNRLVPGQNDCFERIALGAMLPFEKTFRNSDTNSLRICENVCLMDKKCNTFSFGISARGNGTCQLSEMKMSPSSNRPQGTIFDPDFDMYARKSDCLVEAPRPGGFNNGRPMNPFPTNTESPPSTVFVGSPVTDNGFSTTYTITDPQGSTLTGHEHPSTMPGSTRPSPEEELYSSHNPSTIYTTTNRYSPTERYPGPVSPNQNRPSYGGSSSSQGPSGGPPSPNDKRIPIEEYYPHIKNGQRPQPGSSQYPGSTSPDNRYPSSSRPNRHPGAPDRYPPAPGSWENKSGGDPYRYPMLYEKNYPAPNSDSNRYPNGYAQNVTPINVSYNKPLPGGQTNYDNTRPSYGSGVSRPGCRTCENRPGYGYSNVDRNSDRNSYGSSSGNDVNRFGERPPVSKPYGEGVARPSYGGNHYPEPNGTGGYQVSERPQDVNGPAADRPCFRRVLAGKRVASHWVRRTLICERVEECQRECGEEKRFSCEGFNYRLDPTGRGQGDCELVDVPLSQLDLHSSPHNRDANLIRHPDYDYYERDRSASPSCWQVSPCSGCPSKPYRPASGPSIDRNRPEPPPPPSNYGHEKPEIYMPGPVEKYGPGPPIYEPRPEPIPPPPSSLSYFSGGGSVSSQHHYSHGSFEHHGSSIDRYGSEEADHFRPSYPHKPDYVDEPPSGHYGSPPQKPYVDKYPRPDDYRPSKPSYGGDHHSGSGYLDRPSKPSYGGDHHGGDHPSGSGYLDRPSKPSYGGDHHSGDHHSGSGYLDRPSKPSYGGDHHGGDHPSGSGYLDRPGSYPVARPESYPISRPESYPISRPESYPISRPESYPISRPESYPIARPDSYPAPRPQYQYGDRDRPPYYKPSSNFIPYQIDHSSSGGSSSWGQYGGTYGHSSYKPQSDYWGLTTNDNHGYGNRRKDHYNYNDISAGGGVGLIIGSGYRPIYEDNSVYPPVRYGSGGGNKISHDHYNHGQSGHRNEFGTQWTRRPGIDECSVKSSEGFRLHKGVVRHAMSVPNVIECEKMCVGETRFRCHTFSFRYSSMSRENCLLCDKPYNLLDFYADLEPDRDFDIYSMSDEMKTCSKNSLHSEPKTNTQCFFRAIDGNRFFKSIIRESMSARSIGECELECIKSNKFTCRAFSFRYDSAVSTSGAGNCELSDWPVRDMDKERHLLSDKPFDVFERASYGQGCEVQPIVDDQKTKKFCYLGYGSPAKLLSAAIKKVISASSETDCKNECIRLRETTSFKCLSFSYGSQASTFNCEMSDLDQTELKLDVHYTHTNDRDFWLFAWNPFDFTCRDKVTTIGTTTSGSRVNNERRMDIFREPGDGTWRQFTVSGKQCRSGTKCEKNLVTGFYSCELEGGEIGSWDYCCKNDHPCGYSREFDYPWCFVGDKPDQWRTCSEKYFPTKSPISSSGSGSGGITRFPNRKKGEIHQSPPRPGGLQAIDDASDAASLRWPVTFLHNEGPPNSTDITNNVIDCKKDNC